MRKNEFLYDYSLEYIVYMINKYVDENYSNSEIENTHKQGSSESKVYNILDVL